MKTCSRKRPAVKLRLPCRERRNWARWLGGAPMGSLVAARQHVRRLQSQAHRRCYANCFGAPKLPGRCTASFPQLAGRLVKSSSSEVRFGQAPPHPGRRATRQDNSPRAWLTRAGIPCDQAPTREPVLSRSSPHSVFLPFAQQNARHPCRLPTRASQSSRTKSFHRPVKFACRSVDWLSRNEPPSQASFLPLLSASMTLTSEAV